MKKIEKLYLRNSNYNLAKVMNQLEKEIIKSGGEIIPYKYESIIDVHPRQNINELYDTLRSTEEAIKNIDKHNYTEEQKINILKHLKKHLRATKKELKEKKQFSENSPIRSRFVGSWGSGHISFILNGYYYSLNINDNLLYGHTYNKAKIEEDGETITDKLLNEFGFIAYDNYFSINYDDELIKENAIEILNSLINARECKDNTKTERKQVPNYYNNSWHRETITKEAKKRKIREA